MQRRPTLADVAERAGVSRALVSIVMREAAGASEQTRERVKRAKWLVKQHDGGFGRQRARDANALLLSAGEFVWKPVSHLTGIQLHELE